MNDLLIVFEVLRVAGAIASVGRLALELLRLYRENMRKDGNEEG